MYRDFDYVQNSWAGTTVTDKYQTDYTYDANGNLLTLNRNDGNGSALDSFTYRYQEDGSGNLLKTGFTTWMKVFLQQTMMGI